MRLALGKSLFDEVTVEIKIYLRKSQREKNGVEGDELGVMCVEKCSSHRPIYHWINLNMVWIWNKRERQQDFTRMYWARDYRPTQSNCNIELHSPTEWTMPCPIYQRACRFRLFCFHILHCCLHDFSLISGLNSVSRHHPPFRENHSLVDRQFYFFFDCKMKRKL